MTDTHHLDNAIKLLSPGSSRRAKPVIWSLTHFDKYSLLQTPRGKLHGTYYDNERTSREDAARKAIPNGAELRVYD